MATTARVNAADRHGGLPPCQPSHRSTGAPSSSPAASATSASTSPAAVAGRRRPPDGRAKSAIMIWLSGGASHIDTWDMKPDAPAEYRGTLQADRHLRPRHPAVRAPAAPGQAGAPPGHRPLARRPRPRHRRPPRRLLLQPHRPRPRPHASTSCSTPARPYPTDWPSMASVVALKRPPHPHLPSAITLPHKEGRPGVHPARPVRRPARHRVRPGVRRRHARAAARLHRPGPEPARRRARRAPARPPRPAAGARRRPPLRRRTRRQRATTPRTSGKAFTLLSSRADARRRSTCAREPEAVRERYGPGINAMSMLLARRLVEAGVPFVTVFWKGDQELDDLCKSGGGWDTHGNNFNCLKDRLLPEFDRPFAALLDDLHQRGLLDDDAGAGDERDGPQAEDRRPALRRRRRRRPRPLDGVPVGAAGRRRHPRRAGVRHQRPAAAEYPDRQPRRPGAHRPHRVPRDGHRRPARHRPRGPARST